AHTLRIKLRIACQQLINGGELVSQFDPPELAPYGGLKFSVAPRRAAIVHRKDRETFCRHHLMKQPFTVPTLPPIAYYLGSWAAIDVNDQRNLRGIGLFWQQQTP